jgi:hypothetical protein
MNKIPQKHPNTIQYRPNNFNIFERQTLYWNSVFMKIILNCKACWCPCVYACNSLTTSERSTSKHPLHLAVCILTSLFGSREPSNSSGALDADFSPRRPGFRTGCQWCSWWTMWQCSMCSSEFSAFPPPPPRGEGQSWTSTISYSQY